jgi:hypothetical protein
MKNTFRHYSTGKIVLSNVVIDYHNFAEWTENWKGIHISNGKFPQGRGKPNKNETELLLTQLGFLDLPFKKVTCKKKNRSKFQMFKYHGGHRLTLRGWDIFHISTLITDRE